MKLLVFAAKPPPHHGQSYMVALLLDVLGGDTRQSRGDAKSTPIECYHVDCRVSDDSADMGRARLGKVFPLLKYCFQAIWCRFRFGVKNFYYVPAPGVRSAVYRDWIVMALCRPFFRKLIFHWHGVGLGQWLGKSAHPFERRLTRALLSNSDLSIVLGSYYKKDIQKFRAKQIVEVFNGIPDPCPDFTTSLLPMREARRVARIQLGAGKTPDAETLGKCGTAPNVFSVLYLSLCSREKGLFDTLEAVSLLNQELLKRSTSLRVQLKVAGKFASEQLEREFNARISQPDLNGPGGEGRGGRVVDYVGFAAGAEKDRLFRESDCFCFPTYYPIEGQPVSLIEAMAYGLPVVTTRWRAVPELFPKAYAGLVDPQAPAQVATALQTVLHGEDIASSFRDLFLAQFTSQQFGDRMEKLLLSLEEAPA